MNKLNEKNLNRALLKIYHLTRDYIFIVVIVSPVNYFLKLFI